MTILVIYNVRHYRFQIMALCRILTEIPMNGSRCGLAQYFSLCSCMSTEWLISSGRDKRLVSMATTCAHVNMPAVCADKAWHYVLLSPGLSAHIQLWGLHKRRKCTWILGQNSEGNVLVGQLTHLCLEVKGAKGKVEAFIRAGLLTLTHQENIFHDLSFFH